MGGNFQAALLPSNPWPRLCRSSSGSVIKQNHSALHSAPEQCWIRFRETACRHVQQ